VPLELDPETGCLASPPCLHEATVAEVRETFVEGFPDSHTRPAIWTQYEVHQRGWLPLLGEVSREQWMDGSFTTAKTDPNDIDVVTFLPTEELTALGQLERVRAGRMLRWPTTARQERCHAFIVPIAPEGTPEAATSLAIRAFFLKWFGQGRVRGRECAKGIVRLWVGGQEAKGT
jgi:hypothetical protein